MKHETIAAAVISGGLSLAIGFSAGLLLSWPERQKTYEIVAAAEETAAQASIEKRAAMISVASLQAELKTIKEQLAAEKRLTFGLERRTADYERLRIAHAEVLNKLKKPTPGSTPKKKRTENIRAQDRVFTDLAARISFTGTQFVVTNLNRFDWRRVEMELNYGLIRKGYALNMPLIGAGETIAVGAMQFTKSDGTRFDPFAIKPQKFRIWCKLSSGNQGECSYSWN